MLINEKTNNNNQNQNPIGEIRVEIFNLNPMGWSERIARLAKWIPIGWECEEWVD
jgi:hypothetical protein